MNFNEQQKKAIKLIDGPLLLLAGAGAGKTRVITNRIANMVQNHNIKPSEILAVTFTVKAANEMKERVEKIINKKIEISTFHSFALKLLKEYHKELGYEKNFTIYDVLDQMNIVNLILRKSNFKVEEGTYEIASFISKFKEGNCTQYDFSNVLIFETIFKEYNEILKNNNAMDFSDILVNTDKLLDIPDILDKVQDKFRYIMVDEYQDTNNIQYKIVNKIAKKYRNICVVGDENQSIYGFRGANIKNILNFEKDYPDANIIKLEINYRSTQNIVEASNALIMHNKERIEKNIKSNNEPGSKIKYKIFDNEYDEAEKVIEQIILNIKKNDFDNAILYRTNAQSRIFEEQLALKKIKYSIKDSNKFHERKEIKKLINFLYFINNNNDFYNAFRALNITNKVIGISVMEKIKDFSLKNGIDILEAMFCSNLIKGITVNQYEILNKFSSFVKKIKKLKISEMIIEIYNYTNYFEYLKKESSYYSDDIENLEEFFKSIEKFENENIDNDENLLDSFLNYIEEISTKSENDKNSVKLMTIHSSKGLEFNNIFIVGCEEGQIPKTFESKEKIEEERRLFYVALTRAKKNIFLSRVKEKMINNKILICKESEFIKEIPQKYLELENKNKKKVNVKEAKFSDKNTSIFKVSEKVFHKEFGEGLVSENKDVVNVIFLNSNKTFTIDVANKELKKIK